MPAGITADTWAKIREQAELQLHGRETGDDTYGLLPQQPGAGFALLPDPSPGDLFFDFEGNPFWDANGWLEYLWGILDADRNFTPLHAHDHDTERPALERSSTSCTSGSPSTPTCTSTTTPPTRSPRSSG